MGREVESPDGPSVEKELVERLNSLFLDLKGRSHIEFDKDDDVVMKFIYYCALARAGSFGLEPKSFFETQSIAGNIIPSVCTTNAIIASMMIVSSLKKVGFFITRSSKMVLSVEPYKKSPECFFCTKEVFFFVQGGNATVGDLRSLLVQKFGSCKEIYDHSTLFYDTHYRGSLGSMLSVGRNQLFYVNLGPRHLVLYNHIVLGTETCFIESAISLGCP